MSKVKNKTVIRRIADKTRKAGKEKNVIAILAIALTSLLFSTVFTVGGCILQKNQEELMRQVGTSSHAGCKYLTENEYNQLKQDKIIKNLSYHITVGDVVNESLQKLPTEVSYYQEENARKSFCYPQVGKLPEKEDEIVTSTLVLDALGVECQLGEKVPLEINIDGRSIKRDFILCGYYEGDVIAMAQMALVSKTFQEKEVALQTRSYQEASKEKIMEYSGWIMADFDFSNSLFLEKKAEDLRKRCGFSENTIGVNWAYMGYDMDMGTLGFLLALIGLILLSGYLIIYNIFYINVYGEIRYYGLLKTIGTTGKQLRQIVRRQAYILSLYGIPIGLFAGVLVAKVILPIVMSNLSYSDAIDTKLELNVWIFVGAVLFSFLTVYISCIKPCHIASAVTPIEAVKYTEGQEYTSKKKKKKTRKVSIFALALQNVKRNRKKLIIVVTSLSISLVLFNSIQGMIKGFDLEKVVSSMTISDFSISDVSMDNFSMPALNTEGVTKEILQEIEQNENITEMDNIYVREFYPMEFSDENFSLLEERILDNSASKPKLEAYVMEGEEDYLESIRDERAIDGKIFGIGKMVMEKLENSEGELDWEKFRTGDYVITTRFSTLDDKGINYFYPGEMVSIYNEKGECRQYEVLAVADVPYSCGTKRYRMFDCDYILPEEEFFDFIGKQQPMRTVFNVEDGKEEKVEKWLNQYCENVEENIDYVSKQTILNEFENYKNTILIIGNFLCVILMLIGILNFVNTMVTSVWSRKREFAMMEAVGMTGSQLKQMLFFEGGYYALWTGVVSLVLGTVLNVTVVRAIGTESPMFSWEFSLWGIAICLPFLIAIVLVVPAMCYKRMNQSVLVERMRREE